MNKRIMLFFLIMSMGPAAFGQLQLMAGDRCTCRFNPSNLFFFGGGPGPFQPVFGEMNFFLQETNLPAGTVLRYEMFENDPTERPICTGLITATNAIPIHIACSANNAWADLQGTVRLTMLSGSATLLARSVGLQVRLFANGQYQVWMGGVAVSIDPRLSITTLSNAQVQISWPTNNGTFVLEEAPSLSAATWKHVTNAVTAAAGRFSVVVGTGRGQGVFRLRQP